MTVRPLYTRHPAPLTVLFGDLEHHAAAGEPVLLGTPGSLLERQNAKGFRFYARQYYDVTGKKREQYVSGPVGDPVADDIAAMLRDQIEQANQVLADIRLLGREGFQVADARTFGTLASLHNRGVFRAGGVLIGSHAFGILLNHMGVRAAAYATEDVDLGRAEPLRFDEPPALGLLEMLQESGILFAEVPALDHRQPATRWKEIGRGRFHVDLLVPSPDHTFPIVHVPELRAHAQGVPYLRYLLGETQPATVIARTGCCQVRVPTPERFAVHKVLVSQLRTDRSAKSGKDLQQAATLLAVLSEHHPGAIEEAISHLPISARRMFGIGTDQLGPILARAHPRAWETL